MERIVCGGDRVLRLALVIGFLNLQVFALAGESGIVNYRRYTPFFASSGQPSAEQLEWIARQGIERVIYLAYTDNESAIPAEDRIVTGLGMRYVHVPIDFENPTVGDFNLFTRLMQQQPIENTLVHCQVNFRAATFSFLYRVIYLKVPMAEAKVALDSVWEPTPVWFEFIKVVLHDHGMSLECDGCDWGVNEFHQGHTGNAHRAPVWAVMSAASSGRK